MDHVVSLLVQYGYLVVFGVVLLENLGLPLPGPLVLLVAGGLAAAGKIWLPLVMALAVVAALLGDIVWYALGRWRGRPVLSFLCRLSLNPDTCVANTERFFLRHGIRMLLVAKFLPGLNTVAPPLLGTLHAPVPSFLAFDLAGALIYTASIAGAGFLLGNELVEATGARVAQLGTVAQWGAGAALAGYVAWRLLLRLHVKRALRTVGISPGAVRDLQQQGSDPLLIDVRSAVAVKHNPNLIPGAVRAAGSELDRLVDGLPRDRPIVAYCL